MRIFSTDYIIVAQRYILLSYYEIESTILRIEVESQTESSDSGI